MKPGTKPAIVMFITTTDTFVVVAKKELLDVFVWRVEEQIGMNGKVQEHPRQASLLVPVRYLLIAHETLLRTKELAGGSHIDPSYHGQCDPPLQRVLASQQKPMAHYGMAHYGASPLRTGEPRAAGDLAGHVPGIAELDEVVVDDSR